MRVETSVGVSQYIAGTGGEREGDLYFLQKGGVKEVEQLGLGDGDGRSLNLLPYLGTWPLRATPPAISAVRSDTHGIFSTEW